MHATKVIVQLFKKAGGESGLADMGDTRSVTANAALTLANLAAHQACRLRIADEGAVPPLVRLIADHNLGFVHANAKAAAAIDLVLGYAVGALVNLARTGENQRAIVGQGAVPPLLQLCASSTEPRVLAYAAGAIRILAMHPMNRRVIVQLGAVAPLVALCKNAQVCVVWCASGVLSTCASECTSMLCQGDTTNDIMYCLALPSHAISATKQ